MVKFEFDKSIGENIAVWRVKTTCLQWDDFNVTFDSHYFHMRRLRDLVNFGVEESISA